MKAAQCREREGGTRGLALVLPNLGRAGQGEFPAPPLCNEKPLPQMGSSTYGKGRGEGYTP